MKSTLINMVVVLFTITLVASAGVGYVNMITAGPIEQAKADAAVAAMRNVLPDFTDYTTQTEDVEGVPVQIYTASAQGTVVGYAIETFSKKGFGGMVRLMVGFDQSGKVYNINVLEQSETPGLGTKMTDEDNPLLLSFQGNNPGEMKLAVKKDQGDVDALTAATISSRAYVDAVKRAYELYRVVAQGAEVTSADGTTGASVTEHSNETEEDAQSGKEVSNE
jgi:electron transport complex protein RnfG